MKNVRGATITYNEIMKELGQIPTYLLSENDHYVNDRHWRDGRGWIGWKPVPDQFGVVSEAAQRQWRYVCESFTQKNTIGSNIKRIEGATLGNEPNFNVVYAESKTLQDPVAEANRQRSADELFFDDIDKKMVVWWTQNEVHQIFKDLVRAKSSYGKTAVMVYIPPGFLEERITEVNPTDGSAINSELAFADTTLSFEQVLERIKVEVVHYTNVIDVKDTNFGSKFAIVRLTPNSLNGFDRVGVFYVDTDNLSYFRIVHSDDTDQKISCNLSGNNLCLVFGKYEDTLVTKSVKTLQDGVNHAETGVAFALANINYPETTFINAADITDEKGNTVVPKQGLGLFRYLRGIWQESINGAVLTTPTIHERQGADPEKFDKVSEKKSRDIDMLMQMGFKHLSDSEYASGDSKAKSMDDTDILMSDFESAMNTIGTKVFENVIRLAFHFTGQTTRNKDFNVLFRVNMSHGKLTVDDKKGMREEVAQGLRSDSNYMIAAKVTDNPINEKQLIAAQPPKLLPTNNPPAPKPNPPMPPNPKP